MPPSNQDSESSIAIVLPRGLVISGVVTWSVQVCRHLIAAGRRALLIQHPPLPHQIPYFQADLAELKTVPCGMLNRSTVDEENLAVYRGTLPAVIVPNWSHEAYALCAALSRTEPERLRVIGICHSFEEAYFRTLEYYERIVHTFVAVSEDVAAELARRLPQRKDDILIRACGVEVPADLQRTYSKPDQPLTLLYAGRLDQNQKRVLDLLTLARELDSRGVDFILRIVGEGEAKQRLSEELQLLPPNLRQRVCLEGGKSPEQVRRLLLTHDVGILVSAYEGTSVFMLECLACGCVPVLTRVSGTRGVIQEGINGYTVDVGDLPQMADILHRLAQDRAALEKLGSAGPSTAGRFSISSYSDWFAEVCDRSWTSAPRTWPADMPYFPGSSPQTPQSSSRGISRLVRSLLRRQ